MAVRSALSFLPLVALSLAIGCGTSGALSDNDPGGKAGSGGTKGGSGGKPSGDAGQEGSEAGNGGEVAGNGGSSTANGGKGGGPGGTSSNGGAGGKAGSDDPGEGGNAGAGGDAGGEDGGSAGLGGSGGTSGNPFGGAGGNDPGSAGAGGSDSPPVDPCPDELKLVYVLTDDRELHRFDPVALTFTKVGDLDCKNKAGAFSMAVSRNGFAYAVLDDGSLQQIDVKTAKCTATTFKTNQQGFRTFGMGFTSKDATNETLFVSDSDGDGLAKIDLSTFVLTKVGKYDKLTNRRAELTGNSAGELFGAFEGSPYDVAQIDPTNAKILSVAKQSSVGTGGSYNFAFANWGGLFWLFVGPGTSTDAFAYDPVAKKTEKKKHTNLTIVGAGVSTCAPRGTKD